MGKSRRKRFNKKAKKAMRRLKKFDRGVTRIARGGKIKVPESIKRLNTRLGLIAGSIKKLPSKLERKITHYEKAVESIAALGTSTGIAYTALVHDVVELAEEVEVSFQELYGYGIESIEALEALDVSVESVLTGAVMLL